MIRNDLIKKILSSNVYKVAKETPLEYGNYLSKITNNKMYYKREDLQPIFSFKIRGAFNKIYNLTEEEKKKGIVSCSAGNHAQGVALSAQVLGINSTIVMPKITPKIKIDQVEKYQSKIILHGDNFDQAKKKAEELVINENKILIHPYNDPYVIAGQGTIGMEILKQFNDEKIDYIFCCVGGGGLISGIGTYIKYLRPDIKIIGVEAEDSCSMTESLKQNKIVELNTVGSFADGAAVKEVGDLTFDISKNVVDEMITVSNDEISSSISKFYKDTRTILEPAGALSVTGSEKFIKKNKLTDKVCISIISGANMDFKRLRFISERSDENEKFISVKIPEKPGSFKTLYSYIYPNNVTEFSYRFFNNQMASIYLSYQSLDNSSKIINRLVQNNYEVIDLTNNNLAKDHARYLVGGRSPSVKNEYIFRFHFPEKPGALGKFLNNISSKWNISLFHYRNHGSDMGKVLVGLQVSPQDLPDLNIFLDNLGYQYYPENDNPIYKQFLL